MAAEFNMARIVDLIELERRRAFDNGRKAAQLEDADPMKAAEHRTAVYWHRRTADLIEKAVPAAKNWTGRGRT